MNAFICLPAGLDHSGVLALTPSINENVGHLEAENSDIVREFSSGNLRFEAHTFLRLASC
jgi:hypothetical protein